MREMASSQITAFSAAFAKLSLDVPTTSITVCAICDSPLILIQFGLYRWGLDSRPLAVLCRSGCQGHGVPLAMHRMNPEYIGVYRAYGSVAADVLLRQEPDEEEDEEEDDRKEEDDDGDEDDGYSE